MPINFSAFRLDENWTCREILRGICPTMIKLEKYLFFILIAQSYELISNDDAVVSNSTVTLTPTFVFIQDMVL